MASTKEAAVYILDVGKGAENLTKKAGDCCLSILKQKILQTKKDEVGFVLLRTQRTQNSLGEDMDGYEHITEFLPVSIPTWMTVAQFPEYAVEEKSDSGDWLASLVVAMDILRREKESKKIAYMKIVLFHDFSAPVDPENLDAIILGLKEMGVKLVAVSGNVRYVDDEEGNVKAIFADDANKSFHQQQSESLATRVTEGCDGCLVNFDVAVQEIMRIETTRPYVWNATLEIGSKISINISATIAIKEESQMKFKTESSIEGTTSWKATEYFKNGERIEPAMEEMVKGYMLGSTPIAYDESLGVNKRIAEQKGLKCISFSQRAYVLPEYLCGDGMYLVLAKKEADASEKMMYALVRAMAEMDMVMIARRVYNNGNKPKLMALFPNLEREVPCLSMFELFYADQYLYWYFPMLKTKKTELNAEQDQALEQFMESMDLSERTSDSARQTHNKSIISIEHLPNLTVDCIMDAVTAKVLKGPQAEAARCSNQNNLFFEKMEAFKKDVSAALEKLKAEFPLKETQRSDKRELIRHLGDIPAQSQAAPLPDQGNVDYRTITAVGTVNPCEDYVFLFTRDVEGENDQETSKENYERITAQMRNVISDLLFKSVTDQTEKIQKALEIYREHALFYNPYAYNDWIRELKAKIVARKMFDFWENVIVKNQFGLCWARDCDFFDDLEDREPVEFYKLDLDVNKQPTGNDGDEDVDDLFDNM